MFLHGIFILTDWLDKTSNISILSCKLQTPALLPTHVTVGLPQMEGVAYSAICDATFMSRRVIRVPFRRSILIDIPNCVRDSGRLFLQFVFHKFSGRLYMFTYSVKSIST